MTIWFILYGDADTRSGGFLYDRCLLDYLMDKGHLVHIVSQREGSLFRRVCNNFTLTRLVSGLPDPDVIIADELNHGSLFVSGLSSLRNNAVCIGLVHHLRCLEKLKRPDRILTRMQEKLFLDSMNALICNSSSTAASVCRLSPSSESRPLLIARPGRDALDTRFREKENRTLKILFAGNLIRRKGLETVFLALSLLESDSWQFDICGSDTSDSVYTNYLKDMVQKYGWQKSVRFHGRVNNEVLTSFMEQSDILTVPSSWEGFGIVYLEAMSAGCIPLASSSGGAVEIIEQGVSGYLIDRGDYQSLSAILKDLTDHPEKKKALQKQAWLRSRQFETWSESMKKIENFLTELIE